VKERKILSALEVHHFGSSDKGLLAIESRLVNGIDHATAQAALEEELEKITREPVSETELQKVKNKTESMIVFEDMSLMNRASSLAHYELLGDAHLMNTELEKYRSITADDLLRESQKIFRKENSNTLYYHIRPTQHAE
jgi:predicted Zn-dependent peptidase